MNGVDLIQLLPNLGLAGFAIWIMFSMHNKWQDRMKEKDEEQSGERNHFFGELKEREYAFRHLEKEVRENVLKQLSENSSMMTRIIDHLK